MIYLIAVNSDRLVVLSQRLKRPFRALVISICILVLDEVFRVLINAKVGQVDESFTYIFVFTGVFISRKSHEPIFEQVYSKWVIASYYHIYS